MKCPYRKITEKQIVKRMDNEVSIEISEETYTDCYGEDCAYYIVRVALNGEEYPRCKMVEIEKNISRYRGDKYE